MRKLINISELSILLKLFNSKSNKPANHIIRYWEKEFKAIKPIIIKKRRYYSSKQIKIFQLIKFLLKDKGLTIKGVKKLLKSNINNLDDYQAYSLKAEYQKKIFKLKTNIILQKINRLKKNGKKNSR